MPTQKPSSKTIIIASGNEGKIREIRAALLPLGMVLSSLSELNMTQAPEPHPSFFENALAKARAATLASGLPALADDSGIVVPALKNSPGVLSARYAGENATDEDNNQKLLSEMEHIEDRRAFYYAAMVFVESPDDPAPIFAEGMWHGEIAKAPSGNGGFGYDPIFYVPDAGKTGAEMSLDEKNACSHRGQSLRRLYALMQQKWR